jgi:S-methylmethionine-dependent homocysteine/selenocysteine methylase
MTILLDGGTGRELRRIGAPFRQPEWSALALIEAPHFVRRVHDAFIHAGAEVITTNSYAIVPFHIGAERFAQNGLALTQLAGRLAREAADASPHVVEVAGSLPPICGSYRAEWFDAAFARPILKVLVEGLMPFVDHWQAETLSSIEEAELVREVIDPAHPLWLSFTLRDGPAASESEPKLRSGQSVQEAVAAALRLNAAALLFNCSQPEVMSSALKEARRAAPHLTLGVYANAFPPTLPEAEANAQLNDIRQDLTPEGYLRWVTEWLAADAQIVGGCCGIGPEHIARIRSLLRAR